ncbi:MAG: MFS transporter [Fimbriimonadales bacterium]|nr:MFS transporter [Fimbriimonadales bacterium]MDW8051390.1 MFS transporter [Armatimonadota bacterium]
MANPSLETEVSERGLVSARRNSTFQAMRSPMFRRYWVGAFLSFVGSWIQNVAQSWLVYDLTRSEFLLGMVGFVQGLPMLLAPVGGALADRWNRRGILLVTQSLFALSALVLAILTYAGRVRYEFILALVALNGVVSAVDLPTRQSLVAHLVPREDLANGIALNAAAFHTARIVGPALGGLLLEWVGPATCFLVNALSFGAILIALATIRISSVSDGRQSEGLFRSLREGFAFIRARRGLMMLWLDVFVLSTFGLPYLVLLPVFAAEVWQIGKTGLGQLYTFAGIGSLGGLLITARLGNEVPRGWLIILAANGFGWSVLGFALADSPWLAKGLLVLAGMFGIMQLVSTNTALQMAAPDYLRGRVVSLHTWAINAPAPFAALMIGKLAQQWGAPAAVAGCVSICIVFAAVLAFLREVRGVR